ncbi:hypoxanthine phosphoribosyltransferase [Ahrensia sp. R2A130]|uniref:hypoxanthine phosphoribosyltransferase n=1 Tax=Ahrensia sp. R2A130 TaxID=744979 RepID=UPI0001E0E8F2|nr:hypoxanthine phosphoribosyltransferase [Ahrensia sp. R2A130]EFL88012.1 hypoxanthine phosphoribosyltransferase [Ahrensia sp. R2A130]
MNDTAPDASNEIVVRGKRISTLFSPEQINERNLAMAEAMAEAAADTTNHRMKRDLLVIAVLKGSFIFAADLIRAMHLRGMAPEVEFITLSSYGKGTESVGVTIVKDIDSDPRDRDVLLIDDILESGNTLKFARDLMMERGAASVEIAVLLDKRSKRKADINPDYTGFVCPDHFVVGYGMDVAYAFRELPFVGVVEGDA